MRSYTVPLAFAADFLCVLVFVVLGKVDHETGTALGAVAGTAWPFLGGLVLGWVVTLAWRMPVRIWPSGVFVWAVTVAGGMVLRLLSGEGAPTSFVVVTASFLAVTMLGWRTIARVVSRRGHTGARSGQTGTS
ncbi:hypothetical protein GCM10007147_09620 [Nocardiopsis kunsanensis]|uniref:DUF3054 domain-containing protein n=1 Tax=Nocardiopsis kunsanensis TaxID=141693 RepID=A0A919CFQ9_9ACTN|nr:DUF3054 domain-containing protein [Nocardiopsis kunsanensis]GHD18933.1 hypothetical protein GCM10007147_09620 [Nocardiopsis kunsanensis]